MNQRQVLIIDYEVGNHQSVANALEFLGYDYKLSSSPEDIRNADVYILPGVGAFSEAMTNLNRMDLIKVLNEEVVDKKKPILGICLGMQIMANSSQEKGDHKGLGWIEGDVVAFDPSMDVRIPHVGWNTLKILKSEPLFSRADEASSFYFDHSFHYQCNAKYVAAKCFYGKDFVAAIQKDNIFGVQFHPEKSQNSGLKLYRSFFNYLGIEKKEHQYAL